MFKEFFRYESRQWLRSPMLYIFFAVNFVLVLAACVMDGVQIGSQLSNININSPYTIMYYSALMSLISVVMTATFVNKSSLKDFNTKFSTILFATPLSKSGYFLGRYFSSTLAACIPLLGILLAIVVAPSFASETAKVGITNYKAITDAFFVFLLPNTILISALMYSLAIRFRSTVVTFIGAIFLMLGYLIAGNFTSSMDNEMIAILSDPFGVNALTVITKYWTVVEMNSQWLSFFGPIFINRLIWLLFAVGILIYSYSVFSFADKKVNKKKSSEESSPELNSQFKVLSPLTNVAQSFAWKDSMIQFVNQVKTEYLNIVKSPAFIVLSVFAIFNLYGGLSASDMRYSASDHPVTFIILDTFDGSLYWLIYIIIIYYTGAIIWKERNFKLNEIIDATPHRTWVPLISKYFSIVGMVATILLMSMALGILVQASKGYFHFEPLLYFKQLFLIDLSEFAIITAVCLFIQICANQMYLGFFLNVVFILLNQFLWGGLHIESNLLTVGSVPSFTYSDMHGFALGTEGLIWYNAYWFLFSMILLSVGILFWNRGRDTGIKVRWQTALNRSNRTFTSSFFSIGALWLLIGGYLFYNAEVLNDHITEHEDSLINLEYEKKYKKYKDIPQPRIIALEYFIDIFPEERKMTALTEMKVRNKNEVGVDSIHFSIPQHFKTEFEIPGAKLVYNDEENRYLIYELGETLEAGEELSFKVKSIFEKKGIENEVSYEWINPNGTFVGNWAMMPSIGYKSQREVHDEAKRAEHNLSKAVRLPELQHTCSKACSNTYISEDSDWIDLSCTISTSADQIAISPGTLKREWKEGDRRYFRYELDKPVLNFYSFLSAKYEVKRKKWNDVDLEVYYHKGHDYNVDNMLVALEASLDYFSNNFGPYPHNEARIIEFPRLSSFAQAFPGTMPYAESAFIADLTDKSELNQVFRTIAHEVSHQWWGHQVIAAKMQGATMLSETFAQYSSLMVIEKEYGEKIAEDVIKYEKNSYLKRRGNETIGELPLMKVEDQAYIHYQKGSVVMYALKEYLGEEKLNEVMKSFVSKTAYQTAPYTTSYIFIEELEMHTPDSLQYLIDDLFKSITLYDNKIENASFYHQKDGRYNIDIDLDITKYEADYLGNEIATEVNDYIFVGVYSEDADKNEESLIYYGIHKLSDGSNKLEIELDAQPHKIVIDPKGLLFDRNMKDNSFELNQS